ncbi:MAG TPA: aminotransferase class IV [Candidatus Gracilibacteria bacterium]|nr:aminotransferase class IV [Candidatus Gracilibacteria bacterium]
MEICINGKFFPSRRAKVSVLDHGFLYGDGVYDTLRTYEGRFLDPGLHLARIRQSASGLGIKIPWSDKQLSGWLQQMVQQNGLGNARVRLTITRGLNGFDFTTSKNPTLVITAERLRPDPALYKKGVKVITVNYQRPFPELKTIGLTVMILAHRLMALKKAYEAILIDDAGYVREGTVTNVFMVKNGRLFTPATKILKGITRQRVVKLAAKIGLPLAARDFRMTELTKADEIFLTSTVREIIPVTALNGKKVGKGVPGPVTAKIMQWHRRAIRGL